MTRAKALDKIKKLLRMKRGGTADEIDTALRIARELADKHGINLDSVDPTEDEDRRIGDARVKHGARLQRECTYASLIVGQYFSVTTFHLHGYRSNSIVFVGTWDREIAIYVYKFLVGHFRREWKIKRGRCRNRTAFMWGIYLGLSAKLRVAMPPKPQTPGLVITERGLALRNKYITQHFGELTSDNVAPDHDADEAHYRGWLAGQATEIRKGIKTPLRPALPA
jgi:hypothetical protein